MDNKIFVNIDGKEIVKNRPTVQDWYNSVERIEKRAKLELDPDTYVSSTAGADSYFEDVAQYFDIPLEELKAKGMLDEVTNAYKLISLVMAKCFASGQTQIKNSKS